MKYLIFKSLILLIKIIFIHSKLIFPLKYIFDTNYNKSNAISIFNSYNKGHLETQIEVGSNFIPINFKLTFDSFSMIILNSSIIDIPIKYNINQSKTSQMFLHLFKFKNEPIKEGHLAHDNFHIRKYNDNKTNINGTTLGFFLYPKNIDNIKNEGIIGIGGINIKRYVYPGYNFLYQLKQNFVINVCTIYFSDENKLIIGEYPEISEPDKFLDNQRIDINFSDYNNSQYQYYLFIDNIIFNDSFVSSDNYLLFNLSSFFIEGLDEYKDYVQKVFFNEYINRNDLKCYKGESKLFGEFFYCDKNVDISKMPSLIFQIKAYNYNITLNYDNLFILIEDKLFFIVYFSKKNLIWKIGYHIIKQLNIAFNQDKKTISFSKLKTSKNQEKRTSNNNTGKEILIIVLSSFLISFLSFIINYCYDKIKEKKDKKELEFNLMMEENEVIN